jgi:dihydropyrimidinase
LGIFVDDGRITSLSTDEIDSDKSEKVIDAEGMIVVPGGIEPHAHIGGPRQPERSGAEAVSKAALLGGTTTVLDFATQIPGYDFFGLFQGVVQIVSRYLSRKIQYCCCAP